jgi:hypothetical protein
MKLSPAERPLAAFPKTLVNWPYIGADVGNESTDQSICLGFDMDGSIFMQDGRSHSATGKLLETAPEMRFNLGISNSKGGFHV